MPPKLSFLIPAAGAGVDAAGADLGFVAVGMVWFFGLGLVVT
jgi:hypothetical protein